MRSESERILIVGVGNELLGDEGLGVHVARALLSKQASLPACVDVLEAGTALLDAVPEMARHSHVIIVDAICTGKEPGAVYRLDRPADLLQQCETARALSLHDWNLIESLRMAEILGMLPKQLTLIGAEPEAVAPGTELSPRLARAAERIISILLAETGSMQQSGHEDLGEKR